jgi:hypothetical protein
VEEVDLGARAARAGVAHRPEVVGLAHAADALVAEARHLRQIAAASSSAGMAVLAFEHRDHEALRGDLVHLREELPGVGDGVSLK